MSILSFPRINFNGIFSTNPCTANNDDVMTAVVNRDSDTLGASVAGMNDQQVMTYLREVVNMSIPGTSNVCKPYVRSGWNLYGNHFTTFENTKICSVVTGPNAANRITSSAQDPLVGQPLMVLGSATADPTRRMSPILCDLDSTGLVTTQLFVGGLQIGSGGPRGIDPKQIALKVDYDTHGFQNWLNFQSTVGPYGGEQNFVGIGCVMQFGMPASAIPASVPFASPGLQALLKAARAAQGLVLRFRCYEVEPGLSSSVLGDTFANGQAVDNPAFGYLVGTIGVWGVGEPASEPAGRMLQPPYPRPAMSWVSQDGKQNGGMPPAPIPWGNPPALVGNAVANVQQAPPVISLDLAESFPKLGYRNPNGPPAPKSQPPVGVPTGFDVPKQMASVGTVQLSVVPPAGPAQAIAPVNYGVPNYDDYFNFGGIVDLSYDPRLYGAIQQGTLTLNATSAPNAGVTLLQEVPIRVVTDDRTAYVAPGTKDFPIRIKVSIRGQPTTAPTTLYLYEYMNVIVAEPNTNPPNTVCTDGVRPNQTVAQEPTTILSFPKSVTIPAGRGFSNWYAIPISTTPTSGATVVACQLQNAPFAGATQFGVPNVVGVPGWSTATYSAIRVYDNDDFSALYAKDELQWDDVYNNVLRYYYLIYPAMSRFIPLNLADSIVSRGDLIKQRLHPCTDPRFFTTHNMPVTRQMSPNKVKLVLDFINQQQAKKKGGAAVPTVAAARPAAKAEPKAKPKPQPRLKSKKKKPRPKR